MDKTQFALLDGKIKMEIVIPAHNLSIAHDILYAYTDDGNVLSFTLDKINDCGIEFRQPMEKPSPETIRQIKDFARKYGKGENIRSYNVGGSDYSKHDIQPWDIWEQYHLNPWDSDIVKRVLRTKVEDGMSEDESRILDYEKIIHVCKKRIEQLKRGYHF